MWRICSLLFLALAGISLRAQTSATPVTPPPQSARQALIEMFMGRGADDFNKHLPEAARLALIHKGETPETSIALRISNIGRQMVAQGEHLETFDAGPNLLVSEQRDGHERVEVVVEHDSLMGEEDEIELSIRSWKDGQLETLPVVPRLTFRLKQEKEVWTLSEIIAAAHVPLADPDYLQGLRRQQNEANENAAQTRMGIIVTAETGYATNHPDRGYTCTVANLFAQDPGASQGEAGRFYDPGQANEEWNGYRFALAGCDGAPASKYRLTAVPIDSESGMKTFCANESGTLKSVAGGKSSSCFSRGQVINSGAPSNNSED